MNLPDKIGKTYIQRIAHIYGILWEKKYGMKPMVSFGLIGKSVQQLMDLGFNEYQIAYFLTLFFDWAGANGDDDWTRKRLESKTHSIFLLKGEIDSMRAYSKNVLGVDSDDIEKIKPIVDKIIDN